MKSRLPSVSEFQHPPIDYASPRIFHQGALQSGINLISVKRYNNLGIVFGGENILKAKAAALFSLAIVFSASQPAASRPHQKTTYTYYSISGDTPVTIYSTMIKRGPRVGGVKAYAKTSAISTPSVQIVQGEVCKLKDYKLNFAFDINLPKLSNEKALTGSTKAQWQNFSRFLKIHEETHRKIWLEYGAALEAKVWSIKASSCAELAAKIVDLRVQMAKACSKKQDAFDVAEQKRLLRHPFVKLILSRGTKTSNALAIVKK
jgi:predicted secreted Zn-dependent protease